MSRQYRAPTANCAVLAEPGFDAIPALVEANRKLLDRTDVIIGGLPIRELRALARREALELARAGSPPTRSAKRSGLPLRGGGQEEGGADAGIPASNRMSLTSPPEGGVAVDARRESSRRVGGEPDGPLLLAGHQPELSHPGVWVKNFALHGLGRKLGGTAINLIADNDTLKSTSLRFPTFRDGDPTSVRMESVAFDAFAGEVPYEARAILDAELFRSFPERAAPLWANWGYEPLLAKCWTSGRKVGEVFTAMRRDRECEWGCDNLELPVSRLSQTEAFATFASHVLRDLARFREVYNAAIRAYRQANGIRSANHPAPELSEGEAPFWVRTASGRRERATPASDVRPLRPRALTLTLFARVCLGDFFIHGIGGGKYDEVTDAIIRDYFGVEPPAYQVLSATLHLPLPGFPSTPEDWQRAERRVRDLHWNPQRHLTPEQRANLDVKALIDAHASLAANEPPHNDHAVRREWFRALKEANERLRPLVGGEVPVAEVELARVRSEVDANAILRRRDYAWVLYPEKVLREFLTRFLAEE